MSAPPGADTCHRLFETVARRVPDTVAVVDGARRVRYRELDALADTLAARLVRGGAGPETCVGVLVDRSVEQVVAALAAWKAGAAYLALDAHAPRRHVARLVTDARPVVVVTQRRLAPLIPAGIATLAVDDDPPTAPDGPVPAMAQAGADTAAAVIYTSGSTGDSKGVVLTHGALLSSFHAWVAAYDLQRHPRTYLQAAGFGFDVATADLVRTLLSGGTLALCTQQALLDPPRLDEVMRAAGVDSLEITPTLLRHLVGWAEQAHADLGYLTLVVAGGERFTRDDLLRTRRVTGPATQIVNTFGLTEGAVDSAYYVADDDAVTDAVVPVGREFATTRCTVRDDRLRVVPAGTVGEACIAGPPLARGYLGNPRLTARRFLPDPDGAPGARLYATGDRLRRRPDGCLEHVGRTDDEVKIRGVRLNLSDVETAVRALPGVRSAAVVAPDADGGRELAAFVVPAGSGGDGDADGDPGTEGTVRARLLREFPSALAPRHVELVDALPLTPTGKIDRQDLTRRAAAALAAVPAEVTVPAGATATREIVRAVWAGLLGRPPARDDADFFDCGGTSLAAARLAALVGEHCGVGLGPGAVAVAPTVDELVTVVDGLRGDDHVSVQPDPDRTRAPIAPLQRGLWAHHTLDPDSCAYHVPVVLAIEGELDPDRVQAALTTLAARHDALRLRLPDRAAVLELDADATWVLEQVDLRGAAQPEAAADDWIAGRARRGIAMDRAPLAVAALVRTGPASWRLLLVLHHLVGDGTSVRVLLDELGPAYRGDPLPPPALGYLDVAAWQHARWAAGTGRPALARAVDRLRDAPPPAPFPAPVEPSSGPDRRTLRVGPADTAALRELAREQHGSLFVVLLAVWAALEQRWTAATDLVIGTPVGERPVAGTERTVGFFVRTVAVRLRVDPSAGAADHVRRARAALAQSYRDADVPFDAVEDALRPHRGTAPLFRTWFNMLGAADRPPDLGGPTARVLPPPVLGALFGVNVYVTERDGGLDVDLVHDRARLDPAHAAALLGQFGDLLHDVAADPDRPVDAAAPAPPAAGPAPLPYPGPPRAVPARWAGAAAADPHAPAVRSAGHAVGYGRLAGWVADLAARLRRAGDDRPVAVVARRAAGLPVAVLACLRAGVPFVLLDPRDPAALLAERCRQAGARLAVVVDGDGPAGPGSLATAEGAATAGLPVTHTGTPPAPGGLDDPGADPEAADAGALAYVLFTSGSTGAGRGVGGRRGPVDHFVEWYAQRFAITAADRVSLLSGPAHDPVLRDLLVPLSVGAAVCVPPPGSDADPVVLARWLADERVTVAHLTPPLARLLAAVPGADLPALRLVVLAGDAVSAPELAALRRVAPGATLVHGYGCTETPQLAAFAAYPPGAPLPPPGTPVPVGTAAPGVRLDVVAPSGRACGVGELGELVVRGPHLAGGYLAAGGRLDRCDGFAPDGRDFRTGDLARWRPDGTLVVAGRRDDRLTIAGHRVEPAAVEAALRDLVAPADCAVTARPGPDGTPELVGFVTAGVDAAALRHALGTRLPAAGVPARIVTVAALPLTPAGKVDRRRLVDIAPPEPSMVDRPATSSTEARVAAVWRSVLGGGPIDRHTSFFDAGGSSLALARVQLALAQRLGRTVDLLTLLECSTIAQLADRLDDDGGARRPHLTAVPGTPPAHRRYPDAARRLAVRRHSRLEAAP